MARGKNWTAEEDKALMDIKERFPGMMPTALARVCRGLYVCPDRTEWAIRERFRYLCKPKKAEEETPEEIAEPDNTDNDYSEFSLIAEENAQQVTLDDVFDECNCGFREKYEDILDTIFGHASLWVGDYEDGLFFDIPSLRRWLKQNEAKRFAKRLSELHDRKYGLSEGM